jgi:hypothetical protein
MRSEAKMAGSYHHDLMGRDYDKIQIVTIKEMLENGKKRLRHAAQLRSAQESCTAFRRGYAREFAGRGLDKM